MEDILISEKKDDSFRKFLDKYAGSIKGKINYFITSNKQDFNPIQKNILPVWTAKDFIKLLSTLES